jgi:hypothetical protein
MTIDPGEVRVALLIVIVALGLTCAGALQVGAEGACSAHCRNTDHDAGDYREHRCVCSDEVAP